MCLNGSWDCGDVRCDEIVSCPGNMVYMEKVYTCGHTCGSYDIKDSCHPNDYIPNACGCPNNTMKNENVSGYLESSPVTDTHV